MSADRLLRRVESLTGSLPAECKKRWVVETPPTSPITGPTTDQSTLATQSWIELARLDKDGHTERVTTSLATKCGDCVNRQEGGVCRCYFQIIKAIASQLE